MITPKHKLPLSFYFGQIFFKIMARKKKSEASTFLTIIQKEGGDEGYGTIPPSMIT